MASGGQDLETSASAADLSANLEPTLRDDPDRPSVGYEYLDHTADVQLHAWGPSVKEAFEQCAKAMFGYMTELDTVEECATHQVAAKGHDMQSALYSFLDEWLFNFCAEPFFVPFKVEINDFDRSDDEGAVKISSIGIGETFSLEKHPQGTEVKAITYSAMQINEEDGFAEVFVIVDI